MSELEELRGYERFVLNDRVVGGFGATEVCVVDLAREGAQIEHTLPLRVATIARFWFKCGDVSVSAQALAVWSKIARQKAEGKPLFRTGLRIEEGAAEFARAVVTMADRKFVSRDPDTLKRRRRLREKDRAAAARESGKRNAVITPDQELLVVHVRQRLKSNPEDAKKWSARAQSGLRKAPPELADEMVKYGEEVLAVFEYLERTVPLWLIERVFRGKV